MKKRIQWYKNSISPKNRLTTVVNYRPTIYRLAVHRLRLNGQQLRPRDQSARLNSPCYVNFITTSCMLIKITQELLLSNVSLRVARI